MQNTVTTIPLRFELLDELDRQIEMLAAKTFASFTREEMGIFRNREKRIHELEQRLASIPAAEVTRFDGSSNGQNGILQR